MWLLIPEHLRLGTWDLLRGWTGKSAERVEPRLALQLVGESALCVAGLRRRRCLTQKGFELANGLPFVASDQAIHTLLAAHTIEQAQALQVALGQLRRASGHFAGQLLAVDPHRMRSYSKRQMPRRKDKDEGQALKMAQTFFCLDADTGQPLAFTIGSAARTATQATPGLLEMVRQILQPDPERKPLVLVDCEHFCAELVDQIAAGGVFDLLGPIPRRQECGRQLAQLDPSLFTRRWAGFATATQPYRMRQGQRDYHQIIQRTGERADEYQYKAFLATRPGGQTEALTQDYPKRWHIEEFYNTDQPHGWDRAGTQNLNIRYGHMTMALIAQTAIHQFRERLGDPWRTCDAKHMAHDLFEGLEGDVRVHDDTIFVTYYNAPNPERLRQHYEGLPAKLARDHIDPHVPWLYNFKLDFCFR